MNSYRLVFTSRLVRPMARTSLSNKVVQTKKFSSYSQEQRDKAEFVGFIYVKGAMLAFPVLTAVGGMVGMELVFNKKNSEKTHIGNIFTIIGGCVVGALSTPFYPIIIAIAPLKFIYEYV